MWLTLFFGLILLLFVWDYLNKKHRRDVLKKSNITGGFELPLIGTALQVRGLNAENTIERIRDNLKKHRKIFRAWALHMLVIFSSDIKDLEFILSHPVHIRKNNIYDLLSVWLGDGLLMSTGKKWHSRRKIITPTFHFKILEVFVDVFDKQSRVLMDVLKSKADGKSVVDIFPLICLLALDIIAETAMGVKINAQKDSEVDYVKAVKIVTDLIAERIRSPVKRVDWLFRLTAPKQYNVMMKNIKIMQAFTNKVIQKRRDTLEQTLKENQDQKDDDVGTKNRMALLDVLLQATNDGKPLSNEDIREEVETFMFEGHDTTTSGISFTLYLISRHPEVQQKLFKEVRQVIGDDKDHTVTYRELQDLKYMECVIKESMRLYPPVPIIGRYFSEDVKINNKIIPGNTHFNIPIFVVLRDPDNFKDPNDFKPERFFTENMENISPFTYIPFSAGPRNCIGQKFAMLEMKSTISKMLRCYELLPFGPEIIPSLSLILRSKNGVNMGLKPRAY